MIGSAATRSSVVAAAPDDLVAVALVSRGWPGSRKRSCRSRPGALAGQPRADDWTHAEGQARTERPARLPSVDSKRRIAAARHRGHQQPVASMGSGRLMRSPDARERALVRGPVSFRARGGRCCADDADIRCAGRAPPWTGSHGVRPALTPNSIDGVWRALQPVRPRAVQAW